MIKRMVSGWTWTRSVYLVIGSWVILQSALEGQWLGILLGAWPAAMGLLGLDCAAGNSSTGNCEVRPDAGPE